MYSKRRTREVALVCHETDEDFWELVPNKH